MPILRTYSTPNSDPRRLVGPCDAGRHPGLPPAPSSANRGVPTFSIWQRLARLNNAINGCWVGDLIGVASLFALLIIGSFFVGACQ